MKINTLNAKAFDGTAFLRISLRRYGNRAKVKDDAKLQEYLKLLHAKDGEEVTAEAAVTNGAARAVNSTKVLLRSEKLDAVNEFLNNTKEGLVGRFGKANPSNLMAGLYVVALPLVPEFEDVLDKARKQLNDELLPAAVADFDPAIERARTEPVKKGGLGPLFDARDYISADEFRQLFAIEAQWLTLKVPEDLPPEIRERAEREFGQKMQDAATEVKEALRVAFQELIAHATEKLTPSEDGKLKVFRDSMVGNISQFIEVFSSRNIFGDSELEGLVNKAREVLTGVKPDDLRKKEDVRTKIREQMTAVQTQLDGMITSAKTRKFDLD